MMEARVRMSSPASRTSRVGERGGGGGGGAEAEAAEDTIGPRGTTTPQQQDARGRHAARVLALLSDRDALLET